MLFCFVEASRHLTVLNNNVNDEWISVTQHNSTELGWIRLNWDFCGLLQSFVLQQTLSSATRLKKFIFWMAEVIPKFDVIVVGGGIAGISAIEQVTFYSDFID